MFDFSQEVTDLNIVPQEFHGYYVEGEGEDKGKYVIGDQFKPLTNAVVGLNKSLQASRNEAKEYGAKLTGWAAIAESPEAMQQKLEDLDVQLKDAMGKNKSFDPEKMRNQIAAEWQQKVSESEALVGDLKGQLKNSLVVSAAMSAIAEHKGEPALLMPHIQAQVQMIHDAKTGRYAVQVVDAEGDVRYSPTSGNPMTVKDLVAEMKAHPQLGLAFKSDLKGGGGALGDGASRALHGRDLSTMTATEKIEAGLGS